MSKTLFELFDDLSRGGTRGVVLEGGGEPTLYEEFADIQVLNDLNGLPRVVSAAVKEEKRL